MEKKENNLPERENKEHYQEMDFSDDYYDFPVSQSYDPPSGHVQELPSEMWGMPAKFDMDTSHSELRSSPISYWISVAIKDVIHAIGMVLLVGRYIRFMWYLRGMEHWRLGTIAILS